MFKTTKKFISCLLALSLLTVSNTTVFAGADNSWTEANQTEAAKNGKWNEWCNRWEKIKSSPTQMVLTPGKNSSELNFAWYSKDTEPLPKIKIGKKSDMSDGKELTVTTTDAVSGFKSNKATATNLQENTTYYYSYQVNGQWNNSIAYKTFSTKKFSFLYVGDTQIGSSSSNIPTGSTSKQGKDNASRNDSFNWNNTLNTALNAHSNISFILSAGDQIQSSDKKNPLYAENEIEYAGYLSADALRSIPVATTIGNHDSPSKNYSFHFNNPNVSNLGVTPAGGNYYYTYGNTLFIMLNTNNTNISEHQSFIEQAIKENPNTKWRLVTIHHDIYGSGGHSNEPEIANLRYELVPILEKNNIDVVFAGHDHTYSRSLILKGAVQDKTKLITSTEFKNYTSGKTPIDSKYNDYLSSIEDSKAIQTVTMENGAVKNPKGILYLSASSSSGSKYYNLVPSKQAYIAARWQENAPTYSHITIDDSTLAINTYRTDTGAKIDDTYLITKSADNLSSPSNQSSSNKEQITSSNPEGNIGGVKTGDNFNSTVVLVLILSFIGLALLNKDKLHKKHNKF